jgi:signal transduction histidine kinase
MFDYWIRSLSARLWITSVAALAVSLTLIAGMVFYAFNHMPPERLRGEDMGIARHVAAGMEFDANGQPVSVKFSEKTKWLFEVLPTELLFRVLDESGKTVLASKGVVNGLAWETAGFDKQVGLRNAVKIGNRPFGVVTLRIPHQQHWMYVQSATSVAFNAAVLNEKIEPVPGIIGTVLLIATIIFGLTLTFTVRRVLKPLRDASSAAASITPRNLRTRLSAKGVPSEIKPLLTAFNDALTRLENGFAVQQQFLASAAHELQTPLTLLRGQIELQPEIQNKESMYCEIDLMARQVRQLLHLAEVSESQNFNFGDVDCLEVAQDVIGYLARKADQKNVRVRVDTSTAPTAIKADRSALFILLKNIVENAINATPSRGLVVVTVDADSIRVSDEGPGIDPEHLPRLFDRFWRAPNSNYDGAGLGLAICREIAVAHNWRLSVWPASSGTQFAVSF